MNDKDTPIAERELEIWMPIIDFEEGYQISSHGQVKRNEGVNGFRGRILKLLEDKDKYSIVILCRNGKVHARKVHRLVGIHFVPNPNNLPEINHKFGNKKNNYYKDIEWSTRRQNCIHALQTGLKPYGTEKQRQAVILFNKSKIGKKYAKQKLGMDR